MTQASVVIGGGSRSVKIRLAPDGLLRLLGSQVIIGLAAVAEARPA
jgi:prolyl-tRNA editing enzyme YbaK/EbsC (Cys-tRNA(Pro) deacylase)